MRLEYPAETAPGGTGEPTGAESPPHTSRSQGVGCSSPHRNSEGREGSRVSPRGVRGAEMPVSIRQTQIRP